MTNLKCDLLNTFLNSINLRGLSEIALVQIVQKFNFKRQLVAIPRLWLDDSIVHIANSRIRDETAFINILNFFLL